MQDKSQQNPNIVKLETICDSMASRLTTAAKTLKQELDQSARKKVQFQHQPTASQL